MSSFDFAFGISYNAVFMKRTIQVSFLVTIFGCSALLAQSPDRRQTSTTPSNAGHAAAPEKPQATSEAIAAFARTL